MKQAVISMNKYSPDSIQAHHKITAFLRDQIKGASFIDSKESITEYAFDRVFIVNFIPVYCKFIQDLKKICQKSQQVVWVGNDYTLRRPSWADGSNSAALTSYENVFGFKKHQLVNWNVLTFTPGLKPKKQERPGLCYWGAFREDRRPDFVKYFRTSEYTVWISASGREAQDGFEQITAGASWWSGEDLMQHIGAFGTTIYLEDHRNHSMYCSPANRFYEAISAGLPMAFDTACRLTFARAGLDVSRWFVDGPRELARFMKHRDTVQRDQRKALYRDYRSDLSKELRTALRRL